MRRRTKYLAAAAATVALGPWLPGWLTAAGLDAWNVPALQRRVAADRAAEAELDGSIADIRDQILAKERLSAELVAGRITLAEATDQFEAMVASYPPLVRGLQQMYPDAATDRERVARHVIDYTRNRLADPAERARVGGRMSTELATLFPPVVVPAAPMAATQPMG